jgi:hypothetical protein
MESWRDFSLTVASHNSFIFFFFFFFFFFSWVGRALGQDSAGQGEPAERGALRGLIARVFLAR